MKDPANDPLEEWIRSKRYLKWPLIIIILLVVLVVVLIDLMF